MQLVGFLLSLSSEGLRLGSWTRGSWLVISVCVWQILHLCLTNFIFVFDKFYIGVWQVLYLYLTNIIFVFDKYYICTCTCISKRLRLGSWGSWARQENISYVWLDPESALLCIYVFMLHVACWVFHFFFVVKYSLVCAEKSATYSFVLKISTLHPPLRKFPTNYLFWCRNTPKPRNKFPNLLFQLSGIYRGSSHTWRSNSTL